MRGKKNATTDRGGQFVVNRPNCDRKCDPFVFHLLVSGDASVHGGVDDSVQRHAEQVDVSVQLLVLVLTDQRPQLLVLVLHHGDGVFQRTHLHLRDTEGQRTG